MRRSHRTRLIPAALAAVVLTAAGCGEEDTVPVPDRWGAVKSSAWARAARRAYDGAPPTIPHEDFGTSCEACHDRRGVAVSGVGFAPASPHEGTSNAGATVRCRQCHVFVLGTGLFVANDFVGRGQSLRSGTRATPGVPPTIPHRTLMRENCLACHDGPAAREEFRTSHPERARCGQCHVPVALRDEFSSGFTSVVSDSS